MTTRTVRGPCSQSRVLDTQGTRRRTSGDASGQKHMRALKAARNTNNRRGAQVPEEREDHPCQQKRYSPAQRENHQPGLSIIPSLESVVPAIKRLEDRAGKTSDQDKEDRRSDKCPPHGRDASATYEERQAESSVMKSHVQASDAVIASTDSLSSHLGCNHVRPGR